MREIQCAVVNIDRYVEEAARIKHQLDAEHWRDELRLRALRVFSARRAPWGQKRQRPRPNSEWMQLDASELRIISEDLWSAIHARLKNAREIYRRKTQG